MRRTLFAAVFIVFGALAYAIADGYRDGAGRPEQEVCQRALEQLSKGQRAGFDVLFEASHHPDEKATAWLEKLADAQIDGIRQRVESLGQLYGIDLVHIDEVGHVMRRYYYVCKHERGWVRWRFTFYCPESQWNLVSYHFDGSEDALFLECGHTIMTSDRADAIAERPTDTPSR